MRVTSLECSPRINSTTSQSAGHQVDVPANTNESTREIFPFLRLPNEIRNLIYSYVLQQHTTLRVKLIADPPRKCPRVGVNQIWNGINQPLGDTAPQAALLRTCSQICYEATTMLYEIEFQIHTWQALDMFIHLPGMLGNVKCIRLHVEHPMSLNMEHPMPILLDTLGDLGKALNLRRLIFAWPGFTTRASDLPKLAEAVGMALKNFVYARACYLPKRPTTPKIVQFEVQIFEELDTREPVRLWTKTEKEQFSSQLEEYIRPAEGAIEEMMGHYGVVKRGR